MPDNKQDDTKGTIATDDEGFVRNAPPAAAPPRDDLEAMAAQDKPPAPAPDTTAPEPDKANPEKKIETLGYEVSNLRKQVEGIPAIQNSVTAIGEQIAALSAKIADQGGKATAADAAALNKAQDTLAQTQADLAELDKGDPDEFVPKSVGRGMLRLVNDSKKTLDELRKRDEERTKELDGIKAENRSLRENQVTVAERAFWTDFYTENPDLKGKGPEMWKQVQQQAQEQMAELGVTDAAAIKGAAAVLWKQTLEASKKSDKTTKAPATPPAQPKTVPSGSTKGTGINEPGASKSSGAEKDRERLVPNSKFFA